MFVKLAMSLLPEQYKAYADTGMRMFEHLDTREEIKDAANFLIDSLESDGYLSVGEWARFGGMVGILGKPKPKKNL